VSLTQGSIVWVVVSDAAGRNPKCRPAVVVTPIDEITDDNSFVVVAATSTFSKPF
jgi:mRNA-degrading endonuclease toxin of MazEF toxin-antitoxin module